MSWNSLAALPDVFSGFEFLERRNSVEIDVIDCPFVAVCCDGVWDVLSDQQAVDAVLATAPEYERGAAALRDLAFLHGSTDNVGCRHCHVAQTPPLKLTPRTYLSR